mgnify:CR=1 FL=1|tara:strand:+ start:257 stop:385 length:129 start_codon:yes stop_codon:yes gene_type:complete
MISWKLLWQFILIATILIFILMLVKFTVNGFKDLKEMFKNEK